MRRMDRGLVEHLDEPAMNLCLYGFLCIFGIQYMYGRSSSSSLVSIPNEVRTDLWLSSTSDAEKSVRLYVGFPRERVKSKFLWQDADVMSLADKCIVVGCFVCWDYDKILMETGKFSEQHQGHWKWTRVWCWQSALVVEFYVLERRRSTWSTPKECQLPRLLSLPTVWHTLHMHPW